MYARYFCKKYNEKTILSISITQYKCLDIWGRTPDIIEMQEGIPVYVDDAT